MINDKGFNFIIEQLHNNNYKAYAVGGAVRDSLLNKTCDDIDVTTSATPEQIISVFEKNKKVLSGLKHGTVGVIVKGKLYEVTTFREDGEYKDNRHPESVKFVSDLKGDLSRRDFTINALAYNDKEGYIDLFGGKSDIENRLIKCVGNPDQRFKEDALRLLRALRFSSQLGFTIEEQTSQAILRNKDLLKGISAERILVELKKTLMGQNVAQVMLKYRQVFAVIIPELEPTFDFSQQSVYHRYDVYEHIVRSMERALPDEFIRLVLLFHDIGKPLCFSLDERGRGHFYGHHAISVEIASKVLKRLKVDKNTYYNALKLIELHDRVIKENKVAVKQVLREIGERCFLNLLKVQTADALAHTVKASNTRRAHIRKIRELYREIKRNNECYSLKNLALNGDDIKSLGFSGERVGEILNQLLDAVIAGEPNQKNHLKGLIKYE